MSNIEYYDTINFLRKNIVHTSCSKSSAIDKILTKW